MSNEFIPSVVKDNEITLYVDGDTHVINNSHVNYRAIRTALADGEYDRVLELVDVAQSVNAFGSGKVTVEDGMVMYDDGSGPKALHNSMTNRMLSMMQEGFNVNPMVAFLENLMENPDYRAVNELYGFLEATDLPITEDGHFIAYKMVRDDYTDHHTGRMDNSIGSIVEMRRNMVDPDKNRTCSAGLHFCSQGYLGSYGGGGRVMILKINPRDVVAIPTDYNNAKGRACRYEVTGELERDVRESKSHSFKTSVFTPTRSAQVTETLMDVGEAANLICAGAVNPRAALRKRISRGSVRTKWINGVEKVVVPSEYIPEGHPASDDYELITKSELAGRLNLTRDEVFDYIDCGELSTEQVDGHTMVRWFNNQDCGGYPHLACI